jgi:hypothetical protein
MSTERKKLHIGKLSEMLFKMIASLMTTKHTKAPMLGICVEKFIKKWHFFNLAFESSKMVQLQ